MPYFLVSIIDDNTIEESAGHLDKGHPQPSHLVQGDQWLVEVDTALDQNQALCAKNKDDLV